MCPHDSSPLLGIYSGLRIETRRSEGHGKKYLFLKRYLFKVHWDYVKRLGLVDNNLLGMPRRPCLAVRQYRWIVLKEKNHHTTFVVISREDEGSEHLATRVTFAPVFLFSVEGLTCRFLMIANAFLTSL